MKAIKIKYSLVHLHNIKTVQNGKLLVCKDICTYCTYYASLKFMCGKSLSSFAFQNRFQSFIFGFLVCGVWSELEEDYTFIRIFNSFCDLNLIFFNCDIQVCANHSYILIDRKLVSVLLFFLNWLLTGKNAILFLLS